jgi:hypothetical protein
VVSLIRQSMAAAQTAYDQVNQAGKKLAEMADSNLGSAAGSARKRS